MGRGPWGPGLCEPVGDRARTGEEAVPLSDTPLGRAKEGPQELRQPWQAGADFSLSMCWWVGRNGLCSA